MMKDIFLFVEQFVLAGSDLFLNLFLVIFIYSALLALLVRSYVKKNSIDNFKKINVKIEKRIHTKTSNDKLVELLEDYKKRKKEEESK